MGIVDGVPDAQFPVLVTVDVGHNVDQPVLLRYKAHFDYERSLVCVHQFCYLLFLVWALRIWLLFGDYLYVLVQIGDQIRQVPVEFIEILLCGVFGKVLAVLQVEMPKACQLLNRGLASELASDAQWNVV